MHKNVIHFKTFAEQLMFSCPAYFYQRKNTIAKTRGSASNIRKVIYKSTKYVFQQIANDILTLKHWISQNAEIYFKLSNIICMIILADRLQLTSHSLSLVKKHFYYSRRHEEKKKAWLDIDRLHVLAFPFPFRLFWSCEIRLHCLFMLQLKYQNKNDLLTYLTYTRTQTKRSFLLCNRPKYVYVNEDKNKTLVQNIYKTKLRTKVGSCTKYSRRAKLQFLLWFAFDNVGMRRLLNFELRMDFVKGKTVHYLNVFNVLI